MIGMSAAATFDTLKFANRLERAGLTRAQASEFAEAQREVLEEALVGTFATKSDITALGAETGQQATSLRAEMESLAGSLRVEMAKLDTTLRGEMAKLESFLRGEMAKLESSLRGEMAKLESSLRGEMTKLESSLRGEMAKLHGEMATLKWMMGVLIALAIANFAKQFF